MNIRKAVSPDGIPGRVFRACAFQLAGVSTFPSLCLWFPHASKNPPLCPYQRKITKGGGVCFMINKKWCDNGVTPGASPFCRVPARLIWNISPLSAAHSICPWSFHRSLLLLFTFHHRQTLAWLCSNSTMCSADTLTNTLMPPLSSRGTLTKPALGRSC